VPSPAPPLAKTDLELMRRRFDSQHEQVSGHKAESEPVELVSLRLVSHGLVPQARLSPAKAPDGTVERAQIAVRSVYFGKEQGILDCRIYLRDRLGPGHKLRGPAIVEQLDTTTVIHPEQQATVDDYGNLILALQS